MWQWRVRRLSVARVVRMKGEMYPMKTESAPLGERQHIAFMQRQQICQAYLEVPILYSRTIAGILTSCGESHVPIAEVRCSPYVSRRCLYSLKPCESH